MGIAARGNYDLTQHSSHSGKSLDYLDPSDNRRYIPHVIEPSIGVDRLFLALLTSAYSVETLPPAADGTPGETRTLLSLHPSIAPIKVVVLPLVGNKPEITGLAKNILSKLQNRSVRVRVRST